MSTRALQLSLKKAKDDGYEAWIVERFIGIGKFGIRRDLYNLFDAVAIKKGIPGILGIQACPDSAP